MEELVGRSDRSEEVGALRGRDPRSGAIARGNRSEREGRCEEEGYGETHANPRGDNSIDRVLTRHTPTKEKSQKRLAKVAVSPRASIALRSSSIDEHRDAAADRSRSPSAAAKLEDYRQRTKRIVKEGDSESRSEGS